MRLRHLGPRKGDQQQRSVNPNYTRERGYGHGSEFYNSHTASVASPSNLRFPISCQSVKATTGQRVTIEIEIVPHEPTKQF